MNGTEEKGRVCVRVFEGLVNESMSNKENEIK